MRIIIVRPISKLKVNLKKPIQLWNIETGKAMHNSGLYMELTQRTNLVDGKAYWIPEDRAKKGQVYGFWDVDVTRNASKIHDTQFDPKPQPEPIIKEVVKEVPVEVVKEVEVVREVPVEVIKEVPVEVVKEVKVPSDNLSAVELIRLGLRKFLGIGGE